MPPRRKAAGEAEAKVKSIASKEAASRAEMAAAQALKAAQNPAALAPPPPPPSQTATKPNLLEQVKQKNRAAPANGQTKTSQNRTVAGRVQKSKKETRAEAGHSGSQPGPQGNTLQAARPPSVSKPQPVRRPSAQQQSLQGGSVPSSNTSSVSKSQPLGRPSDSRHSSQGSTRSNATSGSQPQAVRRPSAPQQNLPHESSHSPRPPSTSGQQVTRRPSTSQQSPQSDPVQTPRTPQGNSHHGISHPTLSSPGKQTGFYNPYSQQNGMPTSPVSPSMGSSQSVLRRSSSSTFDQAGRQCTTLPPQFSMGHQPQMGQLPQMGQRPNPAQFNRRQSFGVGLNDGSGQGQLQKAMQLPHNRRVSMSFPQNGYGMQAVQGQSPHSDQILRRLSLGGDSKDGSTQGQMQQMMASQSPPIRRYSQNDYGIQAGQGQPRGPGFQPAQSGQRQQFPSFQDQQGYYRPNQQQGMQPQQMATLSYQSQMQQIQNHNQQSQYHYSNSTNGSGQGNQARRSPMMPPPTANKQINSVPGGPDRLHVNTAVTAVRLLNLQGKEDESSASTQASPERPYNNLNGPSPLKTRPSQNPQSKLVNRRESVSLPSARPTLNRTPRSLSRSITALEDDEDSEMGGMVEDGVTEQLPTSISQAAKPVKGSPVERPVVSEANPSGRRQAPKKFTKSDSITVVNKSSKGGRVQGSSPEPEASSSPPTTAMRGTVPPTPKTWTNLPPPFFQQSSSSASLPPRLGANQTEPINDVDALLVSALINNNQKGAVPESELGAEEHPPSSPPPRLAIENNEFDFLIQDPIDALLVPQAHTLATEGSPKKSIALQILEQRHEDGLAGFTDWSQEDTRLTGVAAKILASISGSVNNRSAPRPTNAQALSPIPVDFKDLAIGHLKRAKEYPGDQSNMCSFCEHEEDWGIGPCEFLLPREAFSAYCADCHRSQSHFATACSGTEPNVESIMTLDKQDELNLQVWRNPALKEAIDSTGGKEAAEMYWRAKELPQNTKCVHDGKDISRYRGILTCRGSPHGQVDVTKPQICRKCIGDKFNIIKHVKHSVFVPILDESRGLLHSRRCMVCTNPNLGIYKCAACPLRLCDGCQTMLSHWCKGHLDILLYQRERAHIRNDAFLLRSDGAGF